MVKKTTSIKIDSELWKEVKKYCIDYDFEISTYLEKILKADLKLPTNKIGFRRKQQKDL